MKHLNERHTWFNLDKNNEDYILRYTTIDGSMLDQKYIEKLENNTNEVVFHKYGVIVFNETLKSIGIFAFSKCSNLTSVTIPNSVTSIGKYAFSDCSNLTSISIPNSVTSIGRNVFSYCSSLTSVNLPNSLTSIEGSAFLDSGLTSVSIPNSVESIGQTAFSGCTGLTSVTIPNSVNSIGEGSFYSCTGLTNITYKGTKAEINAIADIICVFDAGVEIHCTDGDITI